MNLNPFNRFKPLLVLLGGLFWTSCDTFESSPYEVRPPKNFRDINQKNTSRIKPKNADTLTIAVIGDTQRFYDDTQTIVEKINKVPNLDFVVHSGDLVDFGAQREFNWMEEILSQIQVPHVAVVGNHDLIGNGGEIYNLMYGPFNFSFIVNGIKFIYINTCSREYGFSPHVPDIPWLEKELSDTSAYANAVVVAHVQPYNSDFNPALEAPYVKALRKYNKTLLHIIGHYHDFDFLKPYGEDLPFLNTYSTSKKKFLVVKIWKGGFHFITID